MIRDISEIFIPRTASIQDALELLNKTGQEMLLVVDSSQRLQRTVTDGDIRRLLLANGDMSSTLEGLPDLKPLYVSQDDDSEAAKRIMVTNKVKHVPVIDDQQRPIGLISAQDLLDPILLSPPHIGQEEISFVHDAFDTNWIAPVGPNLDLFEKEFALATNAQNCVALSSGTAAIHLGLKVLGVRPGDLVFCSTLTFAASAFPILYESAEPVFIDSEPETWNICPEALENAFQKYQAQNRLPKALILVSLYGTPPKIEEIQSLCDKYGVPILEDAAEALGSKYNDQSMGTFGTVGAFSFNGNKIITTSSGGMLVSDDENLIKRARYLSTQARSAEIFYHHEDIGYNYRMSNVLAGIGIGQIRLLEQRVEQKRQIFAKYQSSLSENGLIEHASEAPWSLSNRWLSAFCLKKEVGFSGIEIVRKLQERGIEARPIWNPMHQQPVFSDADYVTAGGTSVADKLFGSGLCLPSGSQLNETQQDRVISNLLNIIS